MRINVNTFTKTEGFPSVFVHKRNSVNGTEVQHLLERCCKRPLLFSLNLIALNELQVLPVKKMSIIICFWKTQAIKYEIYHENDEVWAK